MVQDFNGFFVKLVQPVEPLQLDANGAPPTAFITDMNVDFNRCRYGERSAVLPRHPRSAGKGWQYFCVGCQRTRKLGMTKAEYRKSTVAWADPEVRMNLIEFKESTGNLLRKEPRTPNDGTSRQY